MKRFLPLGVFVLASLAFAQEPSPTVPPTDTKAEPPVKADYSELSRMIRDLVLKSAPRDFTDTSGWGLSAPFPAKLRLPGLARTTIKVGNETQLAHGTWKKARVFMENPERDFALAVTELKALDTAKYRVVIVGSAPVLIDYEIQQWLNGLQLVSISGRAKAKVRANIECDVKLSLNPLKFPPEVSVDPKVVSNKIEIDEFTVFDPATAQRPGLATDINEQARSLLQGIVRGAEPQIQDQANKAIAQAIRDGKGTFSASKLFEATKK